MNQPLTGLSGAVLAVLVGLRLALLWAVVSLVVNVSGWLVGWS